MLKRRQGRRDLGEAHEQAAHAEQEREIAQEQPTAAQRSTSVARGPRAFASALRTEAPDNSRAIEEASLRSLIYRRWEAVSASQAAALLLDVPALRCGDLRVRSRGEEAVGVPTQCRFGG